MGASVNNTNGMMYVTSHNIPWETNFFLSIKTPKPSNSAGIAPTPITTEGANNNENKIRIRNNNKWDNNGINIIK